MHEYAAWARCPLRVAGRVGHGCVRDRRQGGEEPGTFRTRRRETHTGEGAEAPGEGEGEDGEGEESEGGESDESETSAEESEEPFGVSTENTTLIVLGAVFSLALAGAVLRWPRREAFALAAVFCLGFAALDGRELAHQLDENADTIAVLAGVTLALHLAAAGVARSRLPPSAASDRQRPMPDAVVNTSRLSVGATPTATLPSVPPLDAASSPLSFRRNLS